VEGDGRRSNWERIESAVERRAREVNSGRSNWERIERAEYIPSTIPVYQRLKAATGKELKGS
jgi:hypothetical protein